MLKPRLNYYFYDFLSLVERNNTYLTEHTSCSFEEQIDRTIILRMDDIGAWQYKDSSKILVAEILDRNMFITLGVIPEDLGTDRSTVLWLRKLKNNLQVEIALHGFSHEENEFMELGEGEASSKIREGLEELEKSINVRPITFIPPYNEYSSRTLTALPYYGFKIFSAKKNEYVTDDDLIMMGYTSNTYSFEGKFLVPVEEVIADCKNSLNKRNICVIMLHPQDYLISGSTDDELDEDKYSKFLEMLDELEKLDVEFKNFKDLLNCKE